MQDVQAPLRSIDTIAVRDALRQALTGAQVEHRVERLEPTETKHTQRTQTGTRMTLVTLNDLRKAGGLLGELPAVGTQVGHLLEAADSKKSLDFPSWLDVLVKASAAGFPGISEAEERGIIFS